MARRREFTIEDVPLVGGAVVLDFLNTTGARATPRPRERLHAYADLLIWSERAGLLTSASTDRFRSAAEQRPLDAERALREGLLLREGLYAVLAPLARSEAPAAAAVEWLNRWVTRACAERTLRYREGWLFWDWPLVPDRLDSVLWPILGSAETLLTGKPEALRKCGACDWLFLDTSGRGARRWCKQLCADRARSRRYYHRHRAS